MRTRPSVLLIAAATAVLAFGPGSGGTGVHLASLGSLGGHDDRGTADARLASLLSEVDEGAEPANAYARTLSDDPASRVDPVVLAEVIAELLEPPPPPDPTRPPDFADPIDGRVISPFGRRDGRPHEGADIKGASGASIRASMPGRVVQAGQGGTGYGLSVTIDHGLGITTLYAHLSSVTVRAGAEVTTGDQVGVQGQTGRATTPHLHYEVRIGGRPQNPAAYLGD